MNWNRETYDRLHSLVFREGYPGYKPGVREVPNGDGRVDAEKRYAHVAAKYLRAYSETAGASGRIATLEHYLRMAHAEAVDIALSLGLKAFIPAFETGALRVLEYPAGVGGASHTDFDLFAVNLWRSCPNPGLGVGRYHIGEIGELVGLGKAQPHCVEPLPEPQLSLVYFAIPPHEAVLPGGVTVGAWLAERVARSRVGA
jgi:hypothetical protein